MLGRKQKENNTTFHNAWLGINTFSKAELDNEIDYIVGQLKAHAKSVRSGLAWSGGKDSVCVEFLMREAGIKFPSCLGMTDDLEYPAFLRYITDNMPEDLTVYNSGQTLEWLTHNQSWLFPETAQQAGKWFKAIQHNAQNKFFKEKKLDILITGRRKKDMNYCGENNVYRNKSTGVLRYSPIADWSHELVLACIHYYDLPLAPCYSWPNGWIVGTGCWAARQWTGTVEDAWDQVYSIDPSVVIKASQHINSADQYVRHLGL